MVLAAPRLSRGAGLKSLMVNWIKSKKFHFIFWAVLVVFVFSANPLYIHYFLKNGKPYQPALPLPAASQGIVYQFGYFETTRLDGQDLYQIPGFAFNSSDPLMKNKISIVLRSPSKTLVIATQPIRIPGMIRSYQGYKPGMDQAEFSLYLSQAVFTPGVYTVGILLENQAGPQRTYTVTRSTIKVTPNTIFFYP